MAFLAFRQFRSNTSNRRKVSLDSDWQRPLGTKLFPQDTSRTAEGELSIGGIAVSELAETYGTPLYVLSETDFRARARGFREAFTSAFAPAGDRALPRGAQPGLSYPVIRAARAHQQSR